MIEGYLSAVVSGRSRGTAAASGSSSARGTALTGETSVTLHTWVSRVKVGNFGIYSCGSLNLKADHMSQDYFSENGPFYLLKLNLLCTQGGYIWTPSFSLCLTYELG